MHILACRAAFVASRIASIVIDVIADRACRAAFVAGRIASIVIDVIADRARRAAFVADRIASVGISAGGGSRIVRTAFVADEGAGVGINMRARDPDGTAFIAGFVAIVFVFMLGDSLCTAKITVGITAVSISVRGRCLACCLAKVAFRVAGAGKRVGNRIFPHLAAYVAVGIYTAIIGVLG